MSRKLNKVTEEVVIALLRDSLKRSGLENMPDNNVSLFIRLLFSGLSSYFFRNPDDIIDLGYMRLKKNADIDELFAVEILRDKEESVVNADTLYKFYKGELISEKEIKKVVEGFANELLSYSEMQNEKISNLTYKLNKRRK
jgi:hypothetical protein